MTWRIYDTEQRETWRVIMDLEHEKGVALSDAIEEDERFTFLFYRERRDIDAFVVAVGLSRGSVLEGDSNAFIKEELGDICARVLGASE